MTRKLSIICFSVLTSVFCDNYHPRVTEDILRRQKRSVNWQPEPASHWAQAGRDELDEALLIQQNKKLAKNIVIVIGDGMSLTTVTGGRIYKGQRAGQDGASAKLSWDKFPNVGLSKTYTTNAMVPDSAATAFSMFSGVKTNYYTMGYDSGIELMSLDSMLDTPEVSTVLDWAQEAGMATGLVTTARVTHATPAALYAKTAYRDWECDSMMPEDKPEAAWDITKQLVESDRGQGINVVLGGGRGSFTPAPGPNNVAWNCSRRDGVDLVNTWKKLHPEGKFVKSKSELFKIKSETENVLGLFSWDHMPYDDQLYAQDDTPSLVNMTSKALDLLMARGKDKGFFLMVEGGRIDHANHYAMGTRALGETLAMDRAVEEIVNRVKGEETLIIVTADHSHTLSVGGYPGRTADITGVVRGDSGWVMKADDGQPMSILSYANGPGFKKLMVKDNSDTTSWQGIHRAGELQVNEVAEPDHVFPGAIPLDRETHGGDDVGVWARGPWAHLIHGVHEQSYLAHVMSYAACIGPNKRHYMRNPSCGERLYG